MKVRMLVSISGTRGGLDWPPAGAEFEVGDEEGAQLCAGRLAEPVVEADRDVEKAVRPEAEKRGGLTTENGPTRKSRARKNGE